MTVKLLIVDDEVDFADALAERLEIREFRVTVVYSGPEALKSVEEREPDVVLLDVEMPGISGIEVLKELKRRHPLVQVIMLTGKATVENAIEGMKLGAHDFLFKPADVEDLDGKIRKAADLKLDQEMRIKEREVKNLLKRMGW